VFLGKKLVIKGRFCAERNKIYINMHILLTPWCKIFLEKPVVTQLVDKLHAFMETKDFHRSWTMDHILSSIHSKHLHTNFTKIHFNIILPSSPVSRISLRFSNQNCRRISNFPPMPVTYPTRSSCWI